MAATDDRSLEDLPQPEFEGTVSTDDLAVDGDNPNEMTEENFGLLVDRMESEGWLGGPILTNTEGLIADGEHRWRAAQKLGLTEVPVRQYDIDEPTRRLWRQEMNKNQGSHDAKRDALEYDYLLDSGKSDEVQELTDAADENLDELLDEIRDGPSTPVLYEYDADHEVHFEDCLDGMAERLDGDSVDVIVTDPPYGIDLDLSDTMGSSDVSHAGSLENDGLDDALQLFDAAVEEFQRVLVDDGHLYVFASWKTYDAFRDILEALRFKVRNCLVWCKTTPNNQPSFGTGGTNYGTQHEFILYATHEDASPRSLDRVMSDLILHKHQTTGNEHPTEKPVGLLETLVEQSSDEGDVVLDPFMGAGSTAIAAIRSDRDYVGFEVDEENYRSVIERRISEAKRQDQSTQNRDDDEE